MISLFSSFNWSLQQQLTLQIQELMGSEAATGFKAIISSTTDQPNLMRRADGWGFIILAISASVIFAQLQSSLNLIFQSKPAESANLSFWGELHLFLVRRLICFGMVLTFIFISIVSLFISGLLALASTGELSGLLKVVHHIGSFVVYAFLFAIILKWMPDREVPLAASIKGGLLTALLFMVGKVLIGLYLGQTAVGSAYGAAGSFIVLLVWIYYSALIFLLGAEISAYLCQPTPESPRALGALKINPTVG